MYDSALTDLSPEKKTVKRKLSKHPEPAVTGKKSIKKIQVMKINYSRDNGYTVAWNMEVCACILLLVYFMVRLVKL